MAGSTPLSSAIDVLPEYSRRAVFDPGCHLQMKNYIKKYSAFSPTKHNEAFVLNSSVTS
jgi:hypothetical protein